MQQEAIAIRHPLVTLPAFGVTNIAQNVTDGGMTTNRANPVYVAPCKGYIVALSAVFSVPLTAGSITATVNKNGSAITNCTLTISSTDQGGYVNFSVDGDGFEFAAGDEITVKYTSSADMAPTGTSEFEVWPVAVFRDFTH